MDEYDEDESFITPSGRPGEFVALGRTPLKTIEKRFDMVFESSEYETLNGFFISKMDRIPEDNDQFSVDEGGYNFRILTVKNHVVTDVAIRKIAVSGSDEE
jgi:putative hemolysin